MKKLSLALLCAMFANVIVADTIASGTCGENATWSLGSDSVLTISGTGQMTDFQNMIYIPWQAQSAMVKHAVVEDGITYIGDYAFAGCTNLVSYSFPSSVTHLGNYVFYNCKSLNTVSIPTSITDIGLNAFSGTAWYDERPSGPIYFNDMLYSFKASGDITSVEIKQGIVKICDGAFNGCSSITSITIPATVKQISQRAFYNCRSLQYVSLPNTITKIESRVFYNCHSLESITIPASVKSIGSNAFYGCSKLTSLEIPSSVRSIATKAFALCTGLASVRTCWNDLSTISAVSDIFSDVNMNTCILYVPRDKLTTYLGATPWGDFVKVMEYDSESEEVTLDVRYGDIHVITEKAFRNSQIEWKMPSDYKKVIFNGKDVTGEVADGTFVTPPLTDNSTLSIDFGDKMYDNNGDGKVDSQDVLNIYEGMANE